MAGDRPPGEDATADEVDVAEAAATLVNNQLGAREGFLNESILLLAEDGCDQASRRLFAVAQRDYPHVPPLPPRTTTAGSRGSCLERFADPGTFESPVGMRQLLEGSWLKAYRALAHGQDEQFGGLDRLARASVKRWDAWLRTQAAEEPDVFRRLGVDAEADPAPRAPRRRARADARPAAAPRAAHGLSRSRSSSARPATAPRRRGRRDERVRGATLGHARGAVGRCSAWPGPSARSSSA